MAAPVGNRAGNAPTGSPVSSLTSEARLPEPNRGACGVMIGFRSTDLASEIPERQAPREPQAWNRPRQNGRVGRHISG